ncbi:hypothetical protein ACQCX5_14410 [Propionibacteriaceae bacterium G57]|uniref:hypothetical protein n=1 Tax=Aestuariimicrobium sp. G57 TaxID=3418485 RepID=UPI003DA6E4F9
MAVTAETLATYIGTTPGDPHVAPALAEAQAILNDVLATPWRPIPADVLDQVTHEVAHEIYRRRDSPSGASQFAEFGTGQAVRAPRDPLAQSWPIIRRYVGAF